MILTRKEKENLVIQLASQGKTTREIAKTARISLLDIGKIIRRYTGEEIEHPSRPQSVTSKAFQMFKDNISRVDVAIALNLETDHVVTYLKIILNYRISISCLPYIEILEMASIC